MTDDALANLEKMKEKRAPHLGSPVRRKLHSREPKRCLPRAVRLLNLCTNWPLVAPTHL